MRLVTLLPVALLLVPLAGCAKPHLPPLDQKIYLTNWQCNKNSPTNTIIQVTLAKEGNACKAAIVPPKGSTGNPRACIGKKVIWYVTNNCDKDVLVTFAFNPFTKDREKTVKHGDSREIDSPVIRAKARVTGPDSPPYKYDVLLDNVIDLDPEIEIEGI